MTTAAELLGDHLARAFHLLGGQPVQFDALGGEKTDLPAGAFKESGTGVSTVIVTVDR